MKRTMTIAGLALLASLPFYTPARANPATTSTSTSTRTERDLLGEKPIPNNAYYGVQTARALENFRISTIRMNYYPEFIQAYAMVKIAAARANMKLGVLKPDREAAIEAAAQQVLAGRYCDQFLVDWYQGGAGTSANMNMNEVLANIGLEQMGHQKGDYQFLEPHDDLNKSQSTNDTYPTAIKITLILRNEKLIAEVTRLAAAFRAKGDEFLKLPKMGRTELQDAVPMTLGQEFHAFADALDSEVTLLKQAETALYTINMGATAIGSQINVPKGYPKLVADELARMLHKPIVPAQDLFSATWNQQGFVVYSSALKSLAITQSKIASDLILLSSGPRAGLGEIDLPPLQPGSSIMPGKVNPVIPELVNEISFRVMGNDVTVGIAAHSGQLQLNAYEPVEGLSMLESQALLDAGSQALRTKCVEGIKANKDVLDREIENTVGMVTALVPVLGYEKASELAAEAYRTGKGLIEVVREEHALTEQQIEQILDPLKLANLDRSTYRK